MKKKGWYNLEYYYEEDYPDCLGEELLYKRQPACLTCVWQSACKEQIQADYNLDRWWEDNYDN